METLESPSAAEPPSQTPHLDRVLSQLEAIVAGAIDSSSRDGYFAAMYLRVTREVKRRVLLGAFEDGARMDRLDAIFAQRYLDAHAAYHGGERATESWQVAFDATRRWRPLILQHLLLGMNAHINLDLGIAAVEVSAGAPLDDLRGDFDRINAVLADLTNEVQAGVAASSPLLGVLDFFAGRSDEMLANFSIEAARDGAFQFAQRLADLSEADRPGAIAARDRVIAHLGQAIARPGALLSLATLPFRLHELTPPAEITRRLT